MAAALEALLKRDRLIVAVALTAVTALAWAYLFSIAKSMWMPNMPSVAMPAAAWTPADFGFTFLMWSIMMVGMMTPSVAPMILIYARVGRQAAQQGTPIAAAGWFTGGYLLSWTGFSLLATVAQGVLERLAGTTPMMNAATPRIGGLILIAAGVYQWMPIKDSCLQQCRAPLSFIQQHGGFGKTVSSSFSLGLRHGFYCIGCCWALMALLFAGGVMNVLWIAAITIFVLIEKVVPAGRVVARTAGIGFFIWGLWLILRG